jgi:hypothetical protein
MGGWSNSRLHCEPHLEKGLSMNTVSSTHPRVAAIAFALISLGGALIGLLIALRVSIDDCPPPGYGNHAACAQLAVGRPLTIVLGSALVAALLGHLVLFRLGGWLRRAAERQGQVEVGK